jgi:hypothetical protein
VTSLPLSCIAYVLSAVACAIFGFYRKTDNILLPLSGLIFSVGLLNLCCEERIAISHLPFICVALVLVAVFVLAYRWFCVRLIQRTGVRAGYASETHSNLPIAYVGFTVLAVASPSFTKFENPSFVIYAFVVLVCAVHVPALKFGESRIDKYVVDSGIALSKESADFSSGFFNIAIAALAIPLVVSLIAQGALLGDYRLPVVNAAITAEIFSLLWMFRRGTASDEITTP